MNVGYVDGLFVAPSYSLAGIRMQVYLCFRSFSFVYANMVEIEFPFWIAFAQHTELACVATAQNGVRRI